MIKNFIFSIVLKKSKKKKLSITLFYYISWEIWWGNSKKLICIDKSRFYNFLHPQGFKNFWLNFFNNKPPARDFLTCYSCLYYSFMVAVTITVTISLPSFTKDGVSSIKQKKWTTPLNSVHLNSSTRIYKIFETNSSFQVK